MAAITAAELTYAVADQSSLTPGRVRRKVTVSFPTGANAGTNNAYVTGGIAVDPRAFGCRVRVSRLAVIGFTPIAGNNNPRWMWNGDSAAPKLVAFTNATGGAADEELPNTVTFPNATPQTIVCEVEGY